MMQIHVVRTAPLFVLGTFLLIAPGYFITLFTNSDPIGFSVVVATALAALIRPTASWILFAVLCAMRTVPFIMAALVAISMRIGLAPHGLPWLIMYLAVGALAQLRLHWLRRSGQLED